MTAAPSPRTLPCPRCGALNGADFDRCIRCGAALSKLASSADRARRRIDSASLPATKLFFALTAIVFAAQAYAELRIHHRSHVDEFLSNFLMGNDWGDGASRLGALRATRDAVVAEPWRLLSAVFVHYGALHFGLNMYALADLGRIAERLIGPARLAIAYVVTGIVGYATTVALSLMISSPVKTAGASGAIFGVMGVILGVLIRRRNPAWKPFMFRAVMFSLLFGFGLNAMGMGINNSAHIGGLVCGVLLGVLYGGPTRRASDLGVNVGAGLCVGACVVSIVLALVSPSSKYDRWNQFTNRSAPLIVPARSLV